MKVTLERVLLAVLTVVVVVLVLREFQFQIGLEHLVSAVILTGAAWLLYASYRAYKGANGKWRERLFAAFSQSQTIVATRIQYAIGLVLTFSEWFASIVGEPNVAAQLQQYASPKVSGGLLIGSAVITEMCRRRHASIDPITPLPLTLTGPTGATGP